MAKCIDYDLYDEEDDDLDNIEYPSINEIERKFNKAAEYLQKIASQLNQNDLLDFYGLYKQSTIGNCNIEKPGIFNMQSRSKWNAWNNLKDLPKIQAMQFYIDKLTELDLNWDDDLNEVENETAGGGDSLTSQKNKQKTNQWISVSTFQTFDEDDELEGNLNDNNIIGDNQIDGISKKNHRKIIDYVKMGNLDALKNIENQKFLIETINQLDDSGMSLLHWASDRGNVDIIKFLLTINNIYINFQDIDGQTALHYASSCGHLECIRLLVNAGADRTIKDTNELSCLDVAYDDTIVCELLKN